MPARCGKIKGVLTVIKKGDTIPGIFSLIIGGFTLIYIHQNPKMVVLGGTDGAGVGPGFFPVHLCGCVDHMWRIAHNTWNTSARRS